MYTESAVAAYSVSHSGRFVIVEQPCGNWGWRRLWYSVIDNIKRESLDPLYSSPTLLNKVRNFLVCFASCLRLPSLVSINDLVTWDKRENVNKMRHVMFFFVLSDHITVLCWLSQHLQTGWGQLYLEPLHVWVRKRLNFFARLSHWQYCFGLWPTAWIWTRLMVEYHARSISVDLQAFVTATFLPFCTIHPGFLRLRWLSEICFYFVHVVLRVYFNVCNAILVDVNAIENEWLVAHESSYFEPSKMSLWNIWSSSIVPSIRKSSTVIARRTHMLWFAFRHANIFSMDGIASQLFSLIFSSTHYCQSPPDSARS